MVPIFLHFPDAFWVAGMSWDSGAQRVLDSDLLSLVAHIYSMMIKCEKEQTWRRTRGKQTHPSLPSFSYWESGAERCSLRAAASQSLDTVCPEHWEISAP